VVCCCCPCGPGRSIGCLGGPDDASSLDQEGVREISRRGTGVLGELACNNLEQAIYTRGTQANSATHPFGVGGNYNLVIFVSKNSESLLENVPC